MDEPHFEDQHGGSEVVALRDQQIDIIKILLAAETVSQIVAWIDRGSQFAAAWAEKAKIAITPFGGRPLSSQSGDRDGHRQIVANSAEQFGAKHEAPFGRER